MLNNTKNKEELRCWAKKIRAELDINQVSLELVNKLQNTQAYKQAKNIMIYYPLPNEVNLLELLKDKTKQFYLPKIDGGNLLCCPFAEGDKTCLSCFKTCEPLTEPCEKNLIDLIIVPALAVDIKGYRLGYGGGFYDRFLDGFDVTKVVCIPQELVVETVYPDTHDVKMDIVLINEKI